MSLSVARGGDGCFEISQSMIPLAITNSGCYVLTASLTGIVGTNGITIQSGDVDLNLNGFTMTGGAGTKDAIAVPGVVTFNNVRIRNGIIRDWGGYGVDLIAVTNAGLTNCVIQDLTVYRNGNAGIRSGFNSLIERCRAFQNGGMPGPNPLTTNVYGMGIESENGSVIRQCLALNNNEHGFVPHSAAEISTCVAVGNGHDGLHGSHGTVARAMVSAFNSEGLEIASGGSIVDSVSAFCDEDGIRVESASGTGQGGAVIGGCALYGNLDNGVDVQGWGSRITGVNVYSNADHGLRVVSNCYVKANLCFYNGVAAAKNGIHVSGGGGNRIEGNLVGASFTGVNLTTNGSQGNIVARNAGFGNAKNFDVPGGGLNHFQTPSLTNAEGSITRDLWANFDR